MSDERINIEIQTTVSLPPRDELRMAATALRDGPWWAPDWVKAMPRSASEPLTRWLEASAEHLDVLTTCAMDFAQAVNGSAEG